MVYGLMSLCCWKWESKLVFNHSAVLVALKDCRFQIRWQYVFKNTPLKSQLFVDQIIVINLWTRRESNEKSYLHCYCPARQSSKSRGKELEWLLSWSRSAAAWLGDWLFSGHLERGAQTRGPPNEMTRNKMAVGLFLSSFVFNKSWNYSAWPLKIIFSSIKKKKGSGTPEQKVLGRVSWGFKVQFTKSS